MATLEIKDLSASVGGKLILKGVSLAVAGGERHALMGPNGSGKSTLANVIMGNPKYHVESGDILLDGKSILKLAADERARRGIFLSFQYPQEIGGVLYPSFLRSAFEAVNGKAERMPVGEFRKMLREKMAMLKMDKSYSDRYLNEGFSGGEKKRSEILQMAVLSPKIAVLDEPDSGLDIDSVKVVAEGVNSIRKNGMGVLLITHYPRILKFFKPEFVHIMMGGGIVHSGGHDLAQLLEEKGYGEALKRMKAKV
ncbi:MAG: Fe-S cluster assembly ATPase SufC [Candidatus Micrarchaeota archaeon]